MPRKKPNRIQYSETFKARAVKLANQSERSVSEVARELGIAEKTLLGWVNRAREQQASDEQSATASEKEELKVLRSEVRRLREEAEIFKKAAIYFANQKS